ncbi:hypothetical protein D6745_03145 [Candidatus Woesearchaeota archaeon]|nr:MAG: hypothetical protein D6745_03145 [Candidatus Woesearchaeota archaeon]
MTVKITQYKWAGKWGPFRITNKCEECNLATSTIQSMMEKEFKGKDVEFEIKPWLNHWFYCMLRLAWHPPIIIVNGRKFYQFSHKEPLFDRKKLEDHVLRELRNS